MNTIGMDRNFSLAKPFEDVQKAVNELLDGRILIGHAVHNDLKVLILSLCGWDTDIVSGPVTFTSYSRNERYSIIRL